MAGSVVDRCASRPPVAAGRVVLVAVVVGLLFGAIACAAGLASGHDHAALQPAPMLDAHAAASHHAHDAVAATSHEHAERHGGGADDGLLGGAHPGMACVVSVDLRHPVPSVAVAADHCGAVDAVAGSEWAPDVEPPVPRFS